MEDRRRPLLRRRRVVITVSLLIGVLGLSAVPSASGFACDVYTPSSGTSGDWSVTANWSAGLPTSSTLACWASGVTVTVGSGSQAAASIIGSVSSQSGPLDIDGGTLTLGNSSSDDSSVASLEIDPGGTLAGPGTIAVGGLFSITGGNIGVVSSSVAPRISSASFSATNSGSIQFYAGSITVNGPASINTKYFSSPNTRTASLTDTSPTNPVTFVQPGAYGIDGGEMTITSADGYVINGTTDPMNFQLVQTGGITDIPSGEILYPGNTFELEGGTLQDDGEIGTGANVTGGTLDGTGTTGATVDNPSGTVIPGDNGQPGTLTVLSYVQGAGGTLAIPVNGTAPGDFSVLHDSGPAQLAGTLALEPDSSFANSATPGEQVEFLPYNTSDPLTGTFGVTTVSQPLQNNDSFSAVYDTAGSQVDAVVGPPPAQAPSNTGRPVISGNTAAGDVLTCSPGTWTGTPSPTFTYVGDRDGSPITTASTSDTYTLTTADQGHTLSCVVTGTNSAGHASATSAGVAIPSSSTPVTTTPPAVQAPSGGAAVQGTPLPGHQLTCDPGTWTGDPTFTYQWIREGSPIAGATADAYTVTILDEGMTVSCVITGHNAAGTTSATALGVVVAQKGTLNCPKPSGTLTTAKVGPLALGASRLAERHILRRYAVTHYGFDDFCLYGGWGIRAGYRSQKVVLLLTANPYYKLDGVSPGLPIKSVTKRLHVGKVFPIGLNDWYIAPGRGANYVFKVRHGVIQEIGIANRHDTSGARAKQRAFLAGFKAA